MLELCVPTQACDGCPIARMNNPERAAIAREALERVVTVIGPEVVGTLVKVGHARNAAIRHSDFPAPVVSAELGAPYVQVSGALQHMARGLCPPFTNQTI